MFSEAVLRFHVHVSALRQFVVAVDELLKKESRGSAALKKMTDKSTFGQIFTGLALAALLDGRLDGEAKSVAERLRESLKGKLEPVVEEDEFGRKSASIRVVDSAFLKDWGLLDDMQAFFRLLSVRERRSELLFDSALVSLVSSAEFLVSQLLHTHFEKYPEAADVEKGQVSIAEMRVLGDLDEAIRHKIDEKIEEKLHSFPTKLLEFVKKQIGYDGVSLKEEKHELVEIFQRRHVIVHNGGLVSSKYVLNVADQLRDHVTVGEPLQITREYLETAIDRVRRCFLLFAVGMWKHVLPHDVGAFALLDTLLDDIADEHCWRTTELLCEFMLHDKCMPDEGKWWQRLGYWLALKYQGRFEEVKRDVEASDCSKIPPQIIPPELFELAKYSLLDDVQRVLELVPDCLHKKYITEELLWEEPLFAGVRENERFCEHYRNPFAPPVAPVEEPRDDATDS